MVSSYLETVTNILFGKSIASWRMLGFSDFGKPLNPLFLTLTISNYLNELKETPTCFRSYYFVENWYLEMWSLVNMRVHTFWKFEFPNCLIFKLFQWCFDDILGFIFQMRLQVLWWYSESIIRLQGAKASKNMLSCARRVHLHKSACLKTLFEKILTNQKKMLSSIPKLSKHPCKNHQKMKRTNIWKYYPK